MSFTHIFIERPVMTTLLTVAVFLGGLIAFQFMPITALPKMDFPVIQVTTLMPGASAETMSTSISMPLERQFASVPGIDTISSVNAQDISRITLVFDLDRSIDAAAQDVGAAISAAQKDLPEDLPAPPSYKKINPAEQPVLFLTISSKTMPLWQVNEYAERYVADRLSMITGVAQVEIIGRQKYAVRISVDPMLLKTRDLSILDVGHAIEKANLNPPLGMLQGGYRSYNLDTNSGLRTAKDFESVVIKESPLARVRVQDIGRAEDSVDNDRVFTAGRDGQTIVLAVSRQPGTNTIEVVNMVSRMLPSIQKQLPDSVKLETFLDRSIPIVESVKDVEWTFLLTLFLVVVVIFLFLRDLKSTLIPSITIPLSVIVSFIVMQALGFSLNNLTLLALTLAIGFVVDDAIVVLENILYHKEKGKNALEAAIQGSSEITFTVIAMTLSLAAVFIPLLFMPGIVGRLMKEFSITIVTVVLMSGVISLMVTPVMTRFLLNRTAKSTMPFLYQKFFQRIEEIFNRVLHWYSLSLGWIMARPKQTLYGTGIIFLLNFCLIVVIPKGMIPNEDTGLIYGFMEAPPANSFLEMRRIQEEACDLLKQDPKIDVFLTSLGRSSTTMGTNEGRFFIKLKPKSERGLSAEACIQDLRERFAKLRKIKVTFQSIQNLRIGGMLTKGQYQYTIQAPDMEKLIETSVKFENELKKIDGIQDVSSDLNLRALQAHVEINRTRASQLKVDVADITSVLYSAFGDRQISTIYGDNNSYQVILQVNREQSKDLEDLSFLYVRSKDNSLIALSTLAFFQEKTAPLTVNHWDQLPSVTLSFNLALGTSLGEVVNKIQDLQEKIMPPTVTGGFQGLAQVFQSSGKAQGGLLIAAILTIYIILGVLYESYIHPLTILSGLPSAGIGALISLLLLGFPLDLMGFIGIILLLGIVKKNAIMMIDYALSQQRTLGRPAKEAILEACLRRFRPITMTTFAAIIGSLPIALGMGAGAELRRPLGIAVVGGLLFSQLLTLYITPVVYLSFENLKNKRGKNRGVAPHNIVGDIKAG